MAQQTGKKVKKLFSKEDVTKATKVDMFEFLRSHGKGEFKGGGRYPKYVINGHDSIVIDRRKNYFYHNGAHHGDNIIKFLQEYEGYTFPQAVGYLLGEDFEQHQEYDEELDEPGEFEYPYRHDKSMDQVKDYLINERGLDHEIIDYLIDNNYLRQDAKYKNAIFVWRELGLSDGEVVGAMAQGTVIDHERFGKRGTAKFIAKNSKKNYGFNVTLGKPETYYFFESAIDLLSYWSTHKSLDNCRLMSLEGLKKNSIVTYIQETYLHFDSLPKNGIYYGLDNDAAGHRLFDHVDQFINIAAEKGGKAAPNVREIPFNNHIEQEYFQMYEEIAELYPEVAWEMLATVHKVETNMSGDNKISNEFEMSSSLAVVPGPHIKVEPIDVRAALTEVAKSISELGLTADSLDQLYPSEKRTEYQKIFVQDKLKTTYEMYSSGDYEVVKEVGKDWNNYLKEERSKGLLTEKTPLAVNNREADYVYGDMNETFTYYLQDSESRLKIKTQLVDAFGIHPSIVSTLVQKGMIRQDVNDRIVYLWNDSGIVVGGQIRGTFLDKKAFGRAGYEQKIMDLSKEGYGFNVTLGKPNKICFFQNPEDLLSYWSLNVDQIKDTVLFALSDNKPEHVVDAINNKLEAGHTITNVEMCIGNNQAGMDLLDNMAQLADFNLKNRTIVTDKGAEIGLLSVRPKIGVDWLAELHAKKERQARLDQYQQAQSQVMQRSQEQQMNYSRG